MLKFRLFLLVFSILLLSGCGEQIEKQFDGKWYFEEDLLVQFLPPEINAVTDSKKRDELTEQFLDNTYLLISLKEKKMEMVVFGEETETDFFEIIEELPNTIRIKPVVDNEITRLALLEDGRLEMQMELSGPPMYFTRKR